MIRLERNFTSLATSKLASLKKMLTQIEFLGTGKSNQTVHNFAYNEKN